MDFYAQSRIDGLEREVRDIRGNESKHNNAIRDLERICQELEKRIGAIERIRMPRQSLVDGVGISFTKLADMRKVGE